MDDKGATYVSDLIKHSEAEAVPGTPSPRYLIVLRGGIPGSMLALRQGANSLGRSAENDVQLPDMSVSRRHATLKLDDAGTLLTDLGSSNGTFHNGRRIGREATVAIRDGDRIRFGPGVLVKYTCPDVFEEHVHRELFERTVRDGLTGLYNRTYFQDQVAHLERQIAAKGLGLAVLMLDVDHFKRVNDTFGHEVGDLVLREVAQVIRQATRADDLVARYGGEEFIIALPVVAPDLVSERAERIGGAVSSRRIEVVGRHIRVSASIGVAYSPAGRLRCVSSLISSADAALYQAKAAGRDRVILRGEPAEMSDGRLTTIDFPVHPAEACD